MNKDFPLSCFSEAARTTIGGVLARGGSDVIFVDRFQAHVDAINAHGL